MGAKQAKYINGIKLINIELMWLHCSPSSKKMIWCENKYIYAAIGNANTLMKKQENPTLYENKSLSASDFANVGSKGDVAWFNKL